MRVRSVCMRVMDVHVYDVDLVSVIFRRALAHDTQEHLKLHGVGGHQLLLAVTFGICAW